MKNLLHKKSTIDKIIDTTGDIAKYSLEITLYLLWVVLKFISITLYKFKKQLYIATVSISVFIFLFGNFTTFIEAPKYVEGYYKLPTVNSNLSQVEQMKAIITRVWGKDSWIGLNISRCESGYRPNAINHNTNGTTDEGLFQVNSVHNMPDMQNPTANALYAYSMYKEQGLNPWVSSRPCWGVVIK